MDVEYTEMHIAESDWKVFKKVREKALDRYCRRVLEECERICRDETKSAHERYGTLYGYIHQKDKEMAKAFDDFRRSTAVLCLMLMHKYELLTKDEMQAFSGEVQRSLEEITKG